MFDSLIFIRFNVHELFVLCSANQAATEKNSLYLSSLFRMYFAVFVCAYRYMLLVAVLTKWQPNIQQQPNGKETENGAHNE